MTAASWAARPPLLRHECQRVRGGRVGRSVWRVTARRRATTRAAGGGRRPRLRLRAVGARPRGQRAAEVRATVGAMA
eukprot:2002766-Prymnesium_polylepis.1